MSYFLQINSDYSEQLASNKGYGDLGEWIDSLSHTDFPELSHLWEHGWSQNPKALTAELAEAIKSHLPKDPTVKSTIKGLVVMLKEYDGTMRLVSVTDGFANKTSKVKATLLANGYSEAEADQKIAEPPMDGDL